MGFRFSCCLICLALLPASVSGQIVLSQDFDSGSLDVAASTVNGDTIELVGRQTWLGINSYRWIYFRADNVLGRTLEFRIDEGSFLGSFDQHLFVYSYDQTNWEFFDNGEVTAGDYVFSNDSPFAQSQVYVAYGLPYPNSRVESYVQAALLNPFVTPTPSGSLDGVIAQSAAGTDDVGRPVPALDAFGFKITDPQANGPKLVAVLASGSHSAETPGNFALEGMLDFLLSNDPMADFLRQSTEFYVYPMTNPAGRFGGYYRSNPENPDKDFNRFFNDPLGFTELTNITSSMQIDTGMNVDVLMDFHSWWGSWSSENFVFTVPDSTGDPFFAFLDALEPGTQPIASNGQPGMLRIWGMSEAGLSADFAITPEIGFHPFRYEQDLKDIGASFGIALAERIQPFFEPVERFSVSRGNLMAGDISSLQTSDNLDLVATRAITDLQANVFLEFDTTTPDPTPDALRFAVESAVFARSQVNLFIDLFDFDTGTWETLHSGIASRFVDATVVVQADGDISRFIHPPSRQVRARCRFESVSQRQQFSANVDRVVWLISR